MVKKQSNFSRQLGNNLRMGAYYTDPVMSRRIGYLFQFPDEEVCVLEPSAGDGEALKQVLSEKGKSKIFAVELNADTCKEKLDNNEFIDYYLNADFLNGVKISHNAFGFCFANPPYGQDEDGVRLEQRFTEKVHPYLKPDAPFVLVLPHYVAAEEKFLKSYMARFLPVAFFKFDDAVYKDFKQTALVGLRRKSIGYLKTELEEFHERIKDIEKAPYLPMDRKEVKTPLKAVGSRESAIEYFTTLEFDRKKAGGYLEQSSLDEKLGEFMVPEYTTGMIGQPPVPLKKDLLYLLAIAGGGQGIVGTDENRDVHLQRGVAKIVKKSNISENGEKYVDVEKSYTQITLNIIENDGSIKVLE